MTDPRRIHGGCGTHIARQDGGREPEGTAKQEDARLMRFRFRVAARGAESALGEDEAKPEAMGANAKSRWKRIGLALAAGVLAGCMDSAPPEEDVDGGDVLEDVAEAVDEASVETEDGGVETPDADADVHESEVEAEDGAEEADAESCPTTSPVTENPTAPDIGTVAQNMTEEYTVTVECDGSEGRVLEEYRNTFSGPASRDMLDAAIAGGADTVVFGKVARLTVLRVGIMEFAHYIGGMDTAVGTRGTGGAVDDGVHEAEVQSISDGNVSLAVREIGGTWEDVASLSAGQYYIFPSGRIVMATRINYDSADPAASTCGLAVLEPPVRGRNGGTLSYGGNDYNVSVPVDVMSVLGMGLSRIAP